MNYLDSLNPAQFEAVTTTEGPVLVLAGAGTGKTKVLTHRIGYIIEQGRALPENILAVTFTNKASREMQERVMQITNNVQGLNIGTFHSICAKMLRAHSKHFDLTPSFSIIGADDQLKLVKELMQERAIDIKENAPKVVLSIISKWKDLGLTDSKVSKADIRPGIYEIAYNIYPAYQSRLINSNAVDFGDLLLYNSELLIHHPEVLKSYQERFKYILIDEYQDTSAVQYLWVRMLASSHNNICCVGDDDQSIYSWRGAEVGNILRFEKDFKEATVIRLEQNYRSTTPILKAADNLIKNNTQRHGKTLWTTDPNGEKIKIVSCWNDKEESRFIASKISELLRKKDLAAHNIAVLVRAGAQTRLIEEAMISAALPYKIIGGLKFYDRMEIRDVIAYIRATINHGDDLALERIINVPRRGIGDGTIKEIKNYSNTSGISMFDGIKALLNNGALKTKAATSMQYLISVFESWHSFIDSLSPDSLVKKILEESGYIAALKEDKSEESKGRLDNINEMLRAIAEFKDIRAFMEHASLVMEHDAEKENVSAISVMTLHASKGLEFEAVFLPGWEEGIFPHQRSLNEDGIKGLEEERRIAYVGITRAKKLLWITHAESRFLFHERSQSIPSRFLMEIPPEVSERLSSSFSNIVAPQNKKVHKTINIEKTTDKFGPGNKVYHSSFGEGLVIRRNGDNIDVAFHKVGIKTIKSAYLT